MSNIRRVCSLDPILFKELQNLAVGRQARLLVDGLRDHVTHAGVELHTLNQTIEIFHLIPPIAVLNHS